MGTILLEHEKNYPLPSHRERFHLPYNPHSHGIDGTSVHYLRVIEEIMRLNEQDKPQLIVIDRVMEAGRRHSLRCSNLLSSAMYSIWMTSSYYRHLR